MAFADRHRAETGAGPRIRVGLSGAGRFRRRSLAVHITVFHNAHDGSLAYVIEEGTPERLAALDPVPPLLVIFGTRDQLISPPSSSTKCQARALS
jgi:hypothetical protein